jgi:sialic acid synthase SpsE
VGSADATSYRLLEKLKGHFAHIIISCGLAMANEVAATARLMSGQDFTLMHAVSLYPAPLAKVNLKRMDWLRQFTPSVGYSDHTVGTEAAKLAIARGADYVEKHFCLGRYGPGRAMPWDATPEQMAELVEYARSTDEMLGIEEPEPNAEWMEARQRFIGRFGDNR